MTYRPTILVDQDGVLADFDSHFWERCLQRGYSFDCEPHEQRHRFATDHMTDKWERTHARFMVDHDEDWFADLPVIPGAVEGINALAEVADVWICTKPLEANTNCRDGKAQWVREHLGTEWEKRLIIAPDKSLIVGDILLDDAIKLEWLPRATWLPVVFPAPFNGAGSEWERLPRWDWSQPVEELLRLCYSPVDWDDFLDEEELANA